MKPIDVNDEALLANVRPDTWQNPEPRSRYHLVVVGAGTAGLVTAAGAAGLGARVALVERDMMGGDCLNVGCVPSKGVISAARAFAAARGGAHFGAPVAEGEGDFGAAMTRMRRLRAGISAIDGAKRFSELGVDVYLGSGRFTGPSSVEVGGARLEFRRAVIATGARAALIPIPGLADAEPLTNETIFSLEKLPRRLAVIGAGPIGCEMAQSFARFGSRVTMLDVASHVLPREDPDAASIVQDALLRDGVDYLPETAIQDVSREGATRRIRFERDGREEVLECDEILLAVGRAPNLEGLGLDEAGVVSDRTGIEVDDRLRTANPRIYAVGDVIRSYKFTHLADAHARIVIQNALFPFLPPFARPRASRLTVPWCTYTSPEIAHVGVYAHEAANQGTELDTITIPLADVDRAILDGQSEGFVRVHVKKGSDRILGGTIVADHAGEMIGELCLAVTHGLGLGAIQSTIHPYPTQAEALRKAADAWRRTQLTPTVKKAFETWFRIWK
jgi:pyruvate/2-oxoglutarate dehydrogenase complex dihydrolipoamide dehydrogenase (E3) component